MTFSLKNQSRGHGRSLPSLITNHDFKKNINDNHDARENKSSSHPTYKVNLQAHANRLIFDIVNTRQLVE